MRNNLIKLTHNDETKKQAHASQIVFWKQLMMLQYKVIACYFEKPVHKAINRDYFHTLFTL